MSSDKSSALPELQDTLKSVQQLRRTSSISILLMTLGVITIVAAFFYSITRLRPLENQINEKQQKLVSLQGDINKLEGARDDLLQQQKNIEADLTQKQQRLDFLNEALRQAVDNKPKLANEVIKKTIQSNPTAQIIPHVYIYIRDESQRAKAVQLASLLQEKGFIVPSIEHADDKEYPNQEETEVRFFRYPEDKKEAQMILELVKNSVGITNSRISYVLPEKAGDVQPGQFEIWFKNNPL